MYTSHLVLCVEHQQEDHLISVHAEDVFLGLAALAPRRALLLLRLLLLPEEEGVEVGGAGAGLQGQDPPGVLGQVEVLEHVEGLENKVDSN